MIFRPSRQRRGEDPYLIAKTLLLLVGTAIGIAGISFSSSAIVWTGIGVLAIGMILRLMGDRRRRIEEEAAASETDSE